jgi:hypothetical protein
MWLLDLSRNGSFPDYKLSIRCDLIKIILPYYLQPERHRVDVSREDLKSWLCNHWLKGQTPQEHNGIHQQLHFGFFPIRWSRHEQLTSLTTSLGTYIFRAQSANQNRPVCPTPASLAAPDTRTVPHRKGRGLCGVHGRRVEVACIVV